MQFIGVQLFALFRHAACHYRPGYFAETADARLHRFQRFDVVGRGKAAGAVERQKTVEPHRACGGRFFFRPQRAGAHLHAVGRQRMKGANGDRGAVVQHQVGKYHEVAVGIGHTRGACFAQTRDQLGADALDFRFRGLAIDRYPARHRPSAKIYIVDDRMTVAEDLAHAVRGQHVPVLRALHFNAGIFQVIQPCRMRG